MTGDSWDYTRPETAPVRNHCPDCGQWRLGEYCYPCERPLTSPATGRP